MTGVSKGQLISASKINEVISSVNDITGRYVEPDIKYRLRRDSFVLYGKITFELKDGKNISKLAEIRMRNVRIALPQYEKWKIEPEELVWDNGLDDINGFYVAYKFYDEPGRIDFTVITNVERDDYLDWYTIPLYDVQVEAEKGKFEITADYRYDIKIWDVDEIGESDYGVFRIVGISQTEDDEKELRLKNCNFQFGRETITMGQDGVYSSKSESVKGTWYLKIDHDNPHGASVVMNNPGNTLYQTAIPLFKLDEQGNVINDFRTMPCVPVWGTPQG